VTKSSLTVASHAIAFIGGFIAETPFTRHHEDLSPPA
jgi:hypothetical protein